MLLKKETEGHAATRVCMRKDNARTTSKIETFDFFSLRHEPSFNPIEATKRCLQLLQKRWSFHSTHLYKNAKLVAEAEGKALGQRKKSRERGCVRKFHSSRFVVVFVGVLIGRRTESLKNPNFVTE